MIKQYPLRIDDTIYRKARSKAVLEGISMKELITTLLEMWGEGKIPFPRLQKSESWAKAVLKTRKSAP